MLYIITNVLVARKQAESFYGTFFHITQTTLRHVQGENSVDSRTCENLICQPVLF